MYAAKILCATTRSYKTHCKLLSFSDQDVKPGVQLSAGAAVSLLEVRAPAPRPRHLKQPCPGPHQTELPRKIFNFKDFLSPLHQKCIEERGECKLNIYEYKSECPWPCSMYMRLLQQPPWTPPSPTLTYRTCPLSFLYIFSISQVLPSSCLPLVGQRTKFDNLRGHLFTFIHALVRIETLVFAL